MLLLSIVHFCFSPTDTDIAFSTITNHYVILLTRIIRYIFCDFFPLFG